ncbi:MAG: AAA family ATPase [Actinomycetota bacterium]
MRPTRLELSGFTAFREPTVVDFEGCEYFALCGPTGAGKSSLIDAICFALYGCVPRLGDKQVAPVISQGMIEARVRLDFTISGVAHTAVRVVRKTKAGATTGEARLQRGDTVLAGSADAVTHHVEKLLGLSFKHFTKCVVLPQGEFAEFLHSTLKERQDLLKQLLDMQIYERMGKQANQIAIAAKVEMQSLSRMLDEYWSFATPEALDQHARRLEQIKELSTIVDQAQPKSQELLREEERAREEAVRADDRVARLRLVRTPSDLNEQSERTTAARMLRDQTLEQLRSCETQRTAIEASLESLPNRSSLELAAQAHRDIEQLEAQLLESRSLYVRLVQNESDAAKEQDAAEERYKSALDAFESARLEHRAHELAATLVAGEPCPVCRQLVITPASLDPPSDFRSAELEQEGAARELEMTRAARTQAEKKRVAEQARIAEHEARLKDLSARIVGHEDIAELQGLINKRSAAERELDRASAAEKAARSAHERAVNALESIERSDRDAWKLFDSARDSVSEMEPPAANRVDLAAEWAELTEWAKQRIEMETHAAGAARGREQRAREDRKKLTAQLVAACHALEIDPAPSVSQAVANALAEQQSRVTKMEEALVEIESIKAKIAALDEQQSVSSKLSQHLSAKGFEKWLLDEAVRALLEHASRILLELSGDAYSLELDDKSSFVVIDHRNAGERRLAKTLSGGETFLASLSLALALSERIAEIASEGARLDAIFLDEGFGTLDPETLDVVASAMEGLASQRMVGLVTHVPSIGERVPVRFDVSKNADTSRVERVEN